MRKENNTRSLINGSRVTNFSEIFFIISEVINDEIFEELQGSSSLLCNQRIKSRSGRPDIVWGISRSEI
jgi:hypothetical protein